MTTDLLHCYRLQGLSFEKRLQSSEVIKYLKAQPCDVTGQYGVDVHHVVFKSTGNLAADTLCIALKHELHMELHAIGADEFAEKYNLNYSALIVKHWHGFLRSIGQDTPYTESKKKNRKPSRHAPIMRFDIEQQ